MKLFGLPLFGFYLPFLGFRRMYCNIDGGPVDTGEADMTDERGPIYVEPFVLEWLGFGIPFPAYYRAYDSATGKPLDA